MRDIVLTLGFTFEQDSAQNLLSGVMEVTTEQLPRSTNKFSLAFEVSAFLMKHGAQRPRIQGIQSNQVDQSAAQRFRQASEQNGSTKHNHRQ